jgi:DNA polymerase-3 subunit delta'
MWEQVVGQDRAVSLLREAVARPGHSYLLAGPRGAGVEEAARCFAAALVATGSDDDRAWDLALRSRHPDVVEIDPPEHTIRVDHAKTIIEEAHRSPIEGAHKVIIVFDAERLHEAAANKLLKTLEEPPPTTYLVLVSAGADELLPTIRSRCQRIDFGPLRDETVRAALEASGIEPERAALLAGLAGGRIDRAKAFAGRLAPVRAAFVDAATSLDGSGGAVAEHADAIQAALAEAVAELEATQVGEGEELLAELEASGYPDRTANAMKKRLADRQKREHRRARTEALVEGITALESVYRDALAGPDAPLLNADRTLPHVPARSCDRALRACHAARDALGEFNPNEGLLIERLLLQLPGVAARASL